MPKSRRLTLATVVGARPQFIKAAAFSRHWRQKHREILIHTGQHYDAAMSDIFFKQLKLPKPDHTLGLGGGSHGLQTGRMLEALDALFSRLKPDGVLVYGDTNSTLAGALAASKLHIPVFHIEAGLRSFNQRMPEEINRVLTDHVSSLLFAPTDAAVENLRSEGIRRGVHRVGDIMFDAFRFYEGMTKKLRYQPPLRVPYALATVHRAENTDYSAPLSELCEAFSTFPIPVLWPIHPRTRQALQRFRLRLGSNVKVINPVGYLESLYLQRHASVILTDSGGVQKEAYFQRVPCITLRRETEWVETVGTGHNVIAGQNVQAILRAYRKAMKADSHWPALYGDGHSANRTAMAIRRFLNSTIK